MDPHRQLAYRFLLYHALLDVRRLARRFGGRPRWWNPLDWLRLRRDALRAGEVADWLHNLALTVYAGRLDDFDEARFWQDYEHHCRPAPDLDRLGGYRAAFDRVAHPRANGPRG